MDIQQGLEGLQEAGGGGIAQRLQELRKGANYSQEQLADILGVSRQAISKWETGQGKPEIDNIVKLAAVYHVSTDYILLDIEPMPAPPPQVTQAHSPYLGRALATIAIIAACAVITVLFIATLGLLSKYGIT